MLDLIWRHQKTGGLYQVEGTYRLESQPHITMVAYRNIVTGEAWTRPSSEWHEITVVDEKTGRCGARFVACPSRSPA